MTEAEWQVIDDPQPMLNFLGGKISDRKLRLLACAQYRRLWRLLPNDAVRSVVEMTERYADSEISWKRLQKFAQKELMGEDVAARVELITARYVYADLSGAVICHGDGLAPRLRRL